MIENYNMAINGIKLNKEKEKEMKTNWYYNCYSIINYLNNPEILQKLGVMNMNILFEYVIIRIIFDLQFNDMIDMLEDVLVDVLEDVLEFILYCIVIYCITILCIYLYIYI